MKINPDTLELLPHPNPEWRKHRQRLIGMVISEMEDMKPNEVRQWLQRTTGDSTLDHISWERRILEGAHIVADKEYEGEIQWQREAEQELEMALAARKLSVLGELPENLRKPVCEAVKAVCGVSNHKLYIKTLELIAPAFINESTQPTEESARLRLASGFGCQVEEVATTEVASL